MLAPRISGCRFALPLTAIAAIALGGCATTDDLAHAALNGNLAYEQAANQQLLLNAVRASLGQPMYFTRAGSIKLTAGAFQPKLTFKLPIPPASAASPTYDMTAEGAAVQPSVDVSPLDTQEFMLGITQPMPARTIHYYIEQGWPVSLLLFVFVEAVEVWSDEAQPLDATKHKLITRIDNNPTNKDEFDQFNDFVERIRGCKFVGVEGPPQPLGPELTIDQLGLAHALAAAKTAGLKVSTVPGTTHAGMQKTGTVGPRFQLGLAGGFSFTLHGGSDACQLLWPYRAPQASLSGGDVREAPDPVDLRSMSIGRAASTTPEHAAEQPPQKKTYASLVLRSPEGMLYYLGEIIRVRRDGQSPDIKNQGRVKVEDNFPHILVSSRNNDRRALFRVKVNATEEEMRKGWVAVQYAGVQYVIPRGSDYEDDRSMKVFTLVSQVLQMLNKGVSLPLSGTVRFVQ